MNLLKKLSQLENITPNERELVNHIINHPKETLSLTSKELADVAYVSVATVYRLLTKLDLTGFNEFKVELISSLKKLNNSEKIDPNYPILATDSTEDVIYRMSQLYQNTLDETINLFDENELKESVALLLEASQIDVYASAGNLYFAKNFQFQLQEIGCLINVPEEDYSQRLSAANSTDQNVALIVSYGGRSQTTQAVVKILNKNKTPIILLTSTQKNPISEFATKQLYMASIENHFDKISSFSTRLSLLTIFDLLYAEIFNQNFEKNSQYKLKNYQKMNEKLI